MIGGVEGTLPGNVDADLDNAGQENLAAVLQCEEGDLVVACTLHLSLPHLFPFPSR